MSPSPDRADAGGGHPAAGWYAQPGWYPPPGWDPGPPPPRRSRAVVAWTVGGILLSVALLVLVAIAGLNVGRSVDDMAAAAPAARTTTPADPWELGADPGLDGYAQRCHDGDMQACDDLAGLSGLMTAYEQYGMTCGGRVKAVEVLTCTQLD